MQYEVDVLYTGRNNSDDVIDMLNNTLIKNNKNQSFRKFFLYRIKHCL